MNQWLKLRLSLVFVAFLGFFSLVSFRLVQLQVLPDEALGNLSKRQFTKTDKKAPFRLPIYDRNHEELALSIPVSSIYAHPKKLASRKRTAQILFKHLGGSTAKWLQKLDPKKNFVWVQRQISEDKANRIKNLKIPGIGIESENKRIYPNGALASHVVGFTDIDGNGLAGIELSLNSTLLQEGQKARMAKDGKGNTSYIENTHPSKESDSQAIQLTLDRRIQSLVEQELEKVKSETKARAVMAVVMDPHTGEILALGQRPTFDPNLSTDSASENRQNKLTQALYEPGSTMKVLFAAEALEKGLLTPQSLIDCGNGKIKVGKTIISEAETHHKHTKLTLEKVLAYSSNIGAVRVAQMVGRSGAKEIIRKFGLDSKTGIELGGEATSQLKTDEAITPLLLATMGFGQGISTTPLQLVTAFSPFANGGFLVTPTLVSDESSSEKHLPPNGEQIISEKTAKEMRDILVAVTEDKNGTGSFAKLAGVSVAGKTGTAQKYDPETGYKNNKYYSSFVGFLPAEDPQLLIGVMVDEPKSQYYASIVAAPLFRKIAEQSLHILNRRSIPVASEKTPAPRKDAVAPVELVQSSPGKWLMPNLKGLTLSEALGLLNRYVDKVEVSGNGYVTSQKPEPGSTLDEKSPVSLQLKGFDS